MKKEITEKGIRKKEIMKKEITEKGIRKKGLKWKPTKWMNGHDTIICKFILMLPACSQTEFEALDEKAIDRRLKKIMCSDIPHGLLRMWKLLNEECANTLIQYDLN